MLSFVMVLSLLLIICDVNVDVVGFVFVVLCVTHVAVGVDVIYVVYVVIRSARRVFICVCEYDVGVNVAHVVVRRRC